MLKLVYNSLDNDLIASTEGEISVPDQGQTE
jgi:hypothetical protein